MDFIVRDEDGNARRDENGKAIKKSVTVPNAEGKEVTLIGLYDVTRTETIYMTDKGELVSEVGSGYTIQDGDAYYTRRVGDVEAFTDDDVAEAVAALRKRSEDAKTYTRHPAVTPFRYLPSSFPIEANGEKVQIIGLAGKVETEDGFAPVVKGLDGKNYSLEDPALESQIDENREHGDILWQDFMNLEENLPVIQNDEITHIEEGTESGGTEVQDLQNPVQGNEGEGNNAGQLAGQSGQPVGSGDNSDAEYRPETPDVGGSPESLPEHNGQAESRRSQILRDLITENLPKDKNGTPKTVDDPHLQVETDYQRFSDALNKAKESNPYGLYVDPQSPEELAEKGAISLLSPDGMAGVSVGTVGDQNGNIFGVFNNPNGKAKGVMPYLMVNAIANGGNKLDCYRGFLSDQYAKYGFIPVAKVPFNEAFAPEGWNYKRDGKPDIIVWMHNGDSPETVAQRCGLIGEENGGYKYYDERFFDKLLTFSDTLDENGNVVEGEDAYSKALRYRDRLLESYSRGDNLIITHGIKPSEFMKALKVGGFFAPSIGITREGVKSDVFSKFGKELASQHPVPQILPDPDKGGKFGVFYKFRTKGPIIALFGEKTINPESDSSVSIYSGDAYTAIVDKQFDVDENGKIINKKTGEVISKEDAIKLMFEMTEDSSVITRKYKTLDEMKADSGRLVPTGSDAIMGHKDPNTYLDDAGRSLYEDLSEESKAALESEAKALHEEAGAKPLVELTDKEHKRLDEDPVDVFTDKLVSFMPKEYREGMTASDMQKLLADHGFDVSEEAAGKYLDELDKSVVALADYFEAKIKRFVGLNEAIGYVVPEGETEIIQMMLDAGIPRECIITHNGKDVQEKAASLKRTVDALASSRTPTDDNGNPVIESAKASEPKSEPKPTGLLNVAATIKKAQEASNIPNVSTEGIASMLGSGDEKQGDVQLNAANELMSLCDGNPRLAKDTINACLESPTVDEATTKKSLVQALLTNGQGNKALADLVKKLADGEDVTPYDVDEITVGLNNDYVEDPSAFKEIRKLTGEAPEEDVDTPTDVNNLPDDSLGIKELDAVIGGLGLNYEGNDENGVSDLTDVSGNKFGYVYTDSDGRLRIGIEKGSEYDTPMIQGILQNNGFELDSKSGEFVLPTPIENDEGITPTDVNYSPDTSLGIKGLDSVISKLGLNYEGNDEYGVSELTDLDGKTFGYVSSGNGEIRISLEEGQDTQENISALEESGFTLDSETGDWVLSEPEYEDDTPTDVNYLPDTSLGIKGLDSVIAGLGLNYEGNDENGVSELTDLAGNKFGYVTSGNGEIRIGIESEGDYEYDTPMVHDLLERNGFAFDEDTGEWVLPEPEYQDDESTPTDVSQLTGLDYVSKALNLTIGEPDSGGMMPVYDVTGEKVGYAIDPEEGKATIISFDEKFDDDDVRNVFEKAGFTFDDDTKEWVRLKEATPTGVIPPTTPTGVNPPEQQNIPKGPMRQFNAKTAQESAIFTDEVKKELIDKGVYEKIDQMEEIDKALGWIKDHALESDPDGFWGAFTEVFSDSFNPYTAEGQARLLALSVMANKKGVEQAQKKLATYIGERSTESAQGMTMHKLYKTLTPEGKEESIKSGVQKLEDDINKHRRPKHHVHFEVSQEVIDKAKNAETKQEYLAAMDDLYKNLAAQIPSDMALRIRTLRMAAMLLNPRTHIRNLRGNAFSRRILYPLKNVFGTALEKVLKVPVGERSHSLKRNTGSMAYAKRMADEYERELQGTGKHTETSLEQFRKAFGQGDSVLSKTVGAWVQWLADTNGVILEKEDLISLKSGFSYALSKYMDANGYTEKDMKGKVLQKGIEHSLNEAWEMTFRKFNQFAKTLGDSTNKPAWAQFAINAHQPFLKTPINIARTAYRFSPVGFLKAITSNKKSVELYNEWEKGGFKGQKPRGAKSPMEAIDDLAAGLTGTSLAALGALLGSLGIVKIDPTKGEKRRGFLDYSFNVELLGHKFSIDMTDMAPTFVPILFGGAIWEEADKINKGEASYGSIVKAIAGVFAPLFDTTVFSGWQNLLESVMYSNDKNEIVATLIENTVSQYAQSFFPSIFNATAKTVDPVKRKNYVESGADAAVWQRLVESTENKIPFLSRNNVAYLNDWGEEEQMNPNGDWISHAWAFLENFILPDRVSMVKDSEIDDFLDSVEAETGENLSPTTQSKTVSVNGQKIKLTDKQWHDYHQLRLGLYKDRLDKLIHDPMFAGVDDKRVQAVLTKQVARFANVAAVNELWPDRELDAWEAGAIAADEEGKLTEYIFEKEEEKAVNSSNKQHKNSLYLAIQQDNMDAAKIDIQMLHDGKVKDSTIKTGITKEIKPLYKKAYADGDEKEYKRIEKFLLNLDIGYSEKDFKRWLKD
ncbi:MAG: hypothetical protein K6F61_03830 [Clostridiales bacterium]|nr:hypothetical protein [Clostridiales bacterium]